MSLPRDRVARVAENEIPRHDSLQRISVSLASACSGFNYSSASCLELAFFLNPSFSRLYLFACVSLTELLRSATGSQSSGPGLRPGSTI
jgi:hypothetical protein